MAKYSASISSIQALLNTIERPLARDSSVQTKIEDTARSQLDCQRIHRAAWQSYACNQKGFPY